MLHRVTQRWNNLEETLREGGREREIERETAPTET
jgi:hypothetical protein